MSRQGGILQALDSLGLHHQHIQHQQVASIQDCLDLPALQIPGAVMPRNLLLSTRNQSHTFLLILPPLASFRTSQVSKLLGCSRLSFVSAEGLHSLLGLLPGALSPLALVFDREKRVQFVMERSLLKAPSLLFHPGVNTQSVLIKTEDFINRFLPGLGISPILIDLEEQA